MRQTLLLSALLLSFSPLFGQDNCSSAETLCANSSITRSTIGATTQPSDPALSCGDATLNNNVWFTITAINNGTCTVTVSNIDSTSGLSMEVYTGSCGALSSTGFCTSGSPATGRTMRVIFPITTGTTYYIMVDGTNGNQEFFDIVASTTNNSIIARPDANFNTNPTSGCIPLNVLLDNTSTIYGGTNVTYNWQIDGGPFIPSLGNDTSVVFNTIGTHNISLRVCNNECGCKSISQEVVAQTLESSITVNPSSGGCIGGTINFNGSALIQPSNPFVNPNILSWTWNFGDPASGANNSASGQNVSHVFSGPGTSYTVTLIVNGTCGPDTVTTIVNLRPRPTVSITGLDSICEGVPFGLTANVAGNPANYSYSWSGPGNFSCTSCQSPIVSNLTAGGPYSFSVIITDPNGCTATANKNLTINGTPNVSSDVFLIVCPSVPTTLTVNVSGGIAPYQYHWDPSSGLNNDTIAQPITTNTDNTSYCVTVTDAAGCQSNPECLFINQFPIPVIDASVPSICASSVDMSNTFTVLGASPGSSYSWTLSRNYSLIVSAAVDSSDITVQFPQGVAATYSFTVIVDDTITGCINTVTTTFTVTNGFNVTISGPGTFCEGSSYNLTANVPGNPLIYTYSWTNPVYFACDTCQTSQLRNLVVGTPYTFTVTATDTNGCVGSDTINVRVNQRPTVAGAGRLQICSYDPVLLGPSASGGTPPYSYLWSPSSGLSSATIANPTAVVTNDSTTYSLTVTDALGCQSAAFPVTIIKYPVPVITPSVPVICSTSSNRQNTFTVTGANPGSSYSWGLSSAYGLIVSANTDSSAITAGFPFGVAATYNFTVIVSDAITGCKDTVNYSFNVINGLSMSITGPTQVCLGDTVTLTANGATGYSWTANPPYPFVDSTRATQFLAPAVTTVFTITGSDSSCTQTINRTLTVNSKPIAIAASITPFCPCSTIELNDSSSSSGMNYLWTSLNGSSIANPTAQNTTAQVCRSDTFFLRVTDPVTGCFAQTFVPAISLPKPSAVATVTPDLICSETPTLINLNGSGSDSTAGTTYQWTSSNSGFFISDPAAISTTSTVDGPVVFTLTVTNSFGCDSVVSDTVNVLPVPSLTVTPRLICTLDSARRSLFTITGAAPASAFNWTLIPPCVSPSAANNDTVTFDFSNCSPGTYNFNVNVLDSLTRCSKNLQSSVTLIDQVVLTTSNDTSFCEGGVASLVVSGANTYLWSGGQTSDIITVSGLAASATPYPFIVTGYVGSCQSTDTIFVTVHPVPVISAITGPVSSCLNDTATYTINPLVGTITWTVNGGSIISGQGTTSIRVIWNTAGSGTVTVDAINSFNCRDVSRSVIVTVSTRPVSLTIAGSPIACANTSGIFFVSPVTLGSTYQWTVSGGSIAGSSQSAFVNVTWGGVGSGALTVVETNTAGCTGATVVLPLTIRPTPVVPVISGGQLVCDNSSIPYSVVSTAGSVYNWSVVNAQSYVINSTTDTINVVWGNAGSNQLLVSETNSFGCTSDTASITVVAVEHPVAQVLSDSLILCNNSSVQLEGIANSSTISWYTNGNGTFDNDSIARPVYTASAADTGYIYLTMVVQNLPCTDDSITAAVYHSVPPTVNASALDTTICFGDTTTLVASGSTNYLWYPGGEMTDTIRVSPSETLTYTVSTVNNYGCIGRDSVRINVIPPGIPNGGGDRFICITDSVVQLAGTQQNATGLIWSTLGDGVFVPNETEPDAQYIPGVLDTVARRFVLVLTATGACINLTDTIAITIQDVPVFDAGRDTLISSGPGYNAVALLNISGINLTTVEWTSSGSGSFQPSDTTFNPSYSPSTADYSLGTVYLVVTTTGACVVSDTVRLEFLTFVIPNVFTPYPASPGQNDYFVIPNLPAFSKLNVWDRWGVLIYSSENYLNNWDGFGLASDTYYYILETTDKSYKGWLSILRD